jgi:hypothetical protein
MPASIRNLFLVQDLDVASASGLAGTSRDALRAVADWIESFVARPREELGRPGPVCPFVPGALERRTLWLAPEQVGDRSVSDVVELIGGDKTLFLDAKPIDGDDVDYKAIVVVFSDLAADRAKDLLDEVLQRIAARSYVDEGLVMGGFYEGNGGAAIYNPSFRPFTSPVPFLLMRHAVIGDWKFFLDDGDWLDRWARRYGASAVHALAEELRRLPWRAHPVAPA